MEAEQNLWPGFQLLEVSYVHSGFGICNGEEIIKISDNYRICLHEALDGVLPYKYLLDWLASVIPMDI